jgi:hypothetical protein
LGNRRQTKARIATPSKLHVSVAVSDVALGGVSGECNSSCFRGVVTRGMARNLFLAYASWADAATANVFVGWTLAAEGDAELATNAGPPTPVAPMRGDAGEDFAAGG